MQTKELLSQIERAKNVINEEKDNLNVNEFQVIQYISKNEFELVSNSFVIGYFRGFKANFIEREAKLMELEKTYLNLMMVRYALTQGNSRFFDEDIDLVLQFIEDSLRNIYKFFMKDLDLEAKNDTGK